MSTLETTYKVPVGFKTSIEVLNQVLNVPCSIIEHELKKHNYSFFNQSSNCIDEKMLDIFAEKFCKKLKRYFENSIQEFENLSFEEECQFQEFVHTYSKHGQFTRKWRDIDKDAIKSDFLRQIDELTICHRNIEVEISDSLKDAYLKFAESILCVRRQEVHPVYQVNLSSLGNRINSAICRWHNESLRVFDAADSFLLNNLSQLYKYDLSYCLDYQDEIEPTHDSVSNFSSKEQENYHKRVIFVEKIKQSRLYCSRPSRKVRTYGLVPFFERVYVFARFHIVSDDGTEDEINFTTSLRG